MSSAVSNPTPSNVDEILSDLIVNNQDLSTALDYMAQPLLNNAVIDSGKTGSKAIADFRIEPTNTSETVIANDHNDHNDQGSKASSNTDGQSALTATCSSTRLDAEHDKYDIHSKIFRQPDLLKQHGALDSVKHPCKCRECGAGFNNRTLLTRHQKTHDDTRRSRCVECGAAFKRNYDLLRHQVVHNGKRPYKCDVCEYACNRRDNLTKHKKVHDNK